MNQKIKELIEQAKFREEYYPGGSTVEYRTYINQEKFAELIIQECLHVMGKYNSVVYAGDGIKEHFGIE